MWPRWVREIFLFMTEILNCSLGRFVLAVSFAALRPPTQPTPTPPNLSRSCSSNNNTQRSVQCGALTVSESRGVNCAGRVGVVASAPIELFSVCMSRPYFEHWGTEAAIFTNAASLRTLHLTPSRKREVNMQRNKKCSTLIYIHIAAVENVIHRF